MFNKFFLPLLFCSRKSFLTVPGLIFIAFSACKPRSFNGNSSGGSGGFFDAFSAPSDLSAAETQQLTKTPSSVTLDGIFSPPGTAARVALAKQWEERLLSKFPKSPSLDQRVLMNVVRLTSAKMQSECAESDKITLYRGLGPQPVIHDVAGKTDKKFLGNVYLNTAIRGLYASAVKKNQLKASAVDSAKVLENWDSKKNVPKIENGLPGSQLGANRSLLGNILVEYPWEKLFGLVAGDKRQGSMRLIAINHTDKAILSPLSSTSLDPLVSQRFGPSWGIFRVCPSRAFPVVSTKYFGEKEVFVPFFFLPEEIVYLSGEECAFAIDSITDISAYEKKSAIRNKCTNPNAEQFTWPEFTFPTVPTPSPALNLSSGSAVSDATEAWKQCYMNHVSTLEKFSDGVYSALQADVLSAPSALALQEKWKTVVSQVSQQCANWNSLANP